MSKVFEIVEKRRVRRRHHVRKKVTGTAERPRLTVHKSLRHIYVQLVDDTVVDKHGATSGASVLMVSSVNRDFPTKEGKPLTKREKSEHIGLVLAEKAKEKGILSVVFDRNHNLFHGRIKAVADGARKGGLQF
jgi:large subunit ribosomal protein L18